jgi:predicted flap endonuclease-1-like 5' DNA nuclease
MIKFKRKYLKLLQKSLIKLYIMAKNISEIEGIGPVYEKKLVAAGIKTVEALLDAGASKAGRKKLAVDTGIDEGKLLEWVNMADLFRIKGIGSQFAELLEAAGVDTVKELRNRNPENLHAKLVDVQAEKKITRAVPALKQVTDFVAQAKALPPVVTY